MKVIRRSGSTRGQRRGETVGDEDNRKKIEVTEKEAKKRRRNQKRIGDRQTELEDGLQLRSEAENNTKVEIETEGATQEGKKRSIGEQEETGAMDRTTQEMEK